MDQKFLAVDIGNTSVKLALFKGDKLQVIMRTASDGVELLHDPEAWLDQAADHSPEPITAAAICSVVPDATKSWAVGIERRFGFAAYMVGPETDFGLRIIPEPASAVGRDRLVNASAAFEMYGGPIVVVSMGTATTVDAVAKEGKFLGGAIAPGLATAAKALFQSGAQLPEVEITPPDRAIGRSTTEALQSGIVLGYIGLLEGLIDRVRRELGGRPRVIATGGWSESFSGLVKSIDEHERNLTLDGIRRVWRRNN